MSGGSRDPSSRLAYAHVNNALNPIMAAAYLLERHADDPDAVREYAARIAKAAETGAATSARVGRFIRQDPLDDGSESQLDLGTLTSEVVAMMRSLWAERQAGGPIRLELSSRRRRGRRRGRSARGDHESHPQLPRCHGDGGTITIETVPMVSSRSSK